MFPLLFRRIPLPDFVFKPTYEISVSIDFDAIYSSGFDNCT